jgi:hypothetical protein
VTHSCSRLARRRPWLGPVCGILVTAVGVATGGQRPSAERPSEEQPAAEHPAALAAEITRPELYKPLTEPPCSYCSTQHVKGLIEIRDPVIAWIRGRHNGGAAPLRHFLSATRVVNDTYGLFFYDPDGDYVSVFQKDYGYQFLGWRRGVMIVRGRDGTIWSALSGRALEGPQAGQRLTRVASLQTTWGLWLMLHPESTAYDLFEGGTYAVHELPHAMSDEARRTMGPVDDRLDALQKVLGVDVDPQQAVAFPLPTERLRACLPGEAGGEPVVVFWYAATRSAVAFRPAIDGRALTFRADESAPETAPFVDQETNSRWTLAGRAVDGPLRGRELQWVPSLQCRWYAWAAEYPETRIAGDGEPAR